MCWALSRRRGDVVQEGRFFEVIKKDGFCGHPDCGGALLDRNREALKLFLETLALT